MELKEIQGYPFRGYPHPQIILDGIESYRNDEEKDGN